MNTPAANGLQIADHINDAWELYRRNGGIKERNKLVDIYLDKTKTLSAKLYVSRLSNIADYSDYLHYGLLGLISSIERYDPSYGAQFFTYATYRIKGAIIDGVASMEEKTASSSNELIFKSRFLSIYDEQGEEDLFTNLVDTTVMLAIGFMLEDTDEINDQYSSHAFSELQGSLKNYIDFLDNDEKLVIQYHYFNQIPFVTIAEILGLSKSRIAQIHKKALLVLRAKYSNSLELEL